MNQNQNVPLDLKLVMYADRPADKAKTTITNETMSHGVKTRIGCMLLQPEMVEAIKTIVINAI